MVSGVSVGLCLAVLLHQGVGEECLGGAEQCSDEKEGIGETNAKECGVRVGFFPDLGQCDKYHECKDGQVSSHLCPDGLMYDNTHYKADFQLDSSGTTGKCSYPFSIDCTGREALQPSSPSDGCPRKNGYFSHADCDKYYFCNDGAPNLYNCPGGLVFAPDKGQCTWIEEANRPGCRSEEKIDFTCPEVGPSEHPRYSDPLDCQKFYVCISGSAHPYSCSDGLVFHPITLACDRQESVIGSCSTWYNKTAIEGLTLPDALPTPATAKPVLTTPEAFMDRRRPSRPVSSLPSVSNETMEVNSEKAETASLKSNSRVRTRVRGSVHRQTLQKKPNNSPQSTTKRKPVRRRNPNQTTAAPTDDVQRVSDVLGSTEDTQLPKQTIPRTRVRTRTRISSSSLPNSLKGEESPGKKKTRVRGRVNIRQRVSSEER